MAPPDPDLAAPESCVAYLRGALPESAPPDVVESAPVENAAIRGCRPLEHRIASDTYSATNLYAEKPAYLHPASAPNSWARSGTTYERRAR